MKVEKNPLLFLIAGCTFFLIIFFSLIYSAGEDLRFKRENERLRKILMTEPMRLNPSCLMGICIGDRLLKITNSSIKPFLDTSDPKTIYFRGCYRQNLYWWLQDNLFNISSRGASELRRELLDDGGIEGYLELKPSSSESELQVSSINLTFIACSKKEGLNSLLEKSIRNYSLNKMSNANNENPQLEAFFSSDGKVSVFFNKGQPEKNPFYNHGKSCERLRILLQ